MNEMQVVCHRVGSVSPQPGLIIRLRELLCLYFRLCVITIQSEGCFQLNNSYTKNTFIIALKNVKAACQYVSIQYMSMNPPLDEQSPLFTAFHAPILQSDLWFGNRPFVMSQSVPLAGLISGLHSALCDAEPEAAAPVSVNELVMSTLQGNQPPVCTCE